VWLGYSDNVYRQRWLRGHSFTQAKVEGMVLKAACTWDSYISVTND